MEKRRFLYLFLLCLWLFNVQAQNEVTFSQVWLNKTFYNPSFAGNSDKIQISGAGKYMWTGIENSPKQIYLSADMPVEFMGLNHGIGLSTYQTSIENKRNSLFAAQYVLKLKLGKGSVNIGVQAGLLELNFDPSSTQLTSDTTRNNQKTLKTNPVTDKKALDLNAGVSWTSPKFFIGAAVNHVTQPSFFALPIVHSNNETVNDSTLSRIPLSYNFMTGYNITRFYPLEIQPMFFAKTHDEDFYFQTALRMVYNKKYSVGASWNGNNGYSFFAGIQFGDLEVGYAYDLLTSGIGKESNGNHEIGIRYLLPIELWNKKPKPHKSIRLL